MQAVTDLPALLDTIAGGRAAKLRIPEEHRDSPSVLGSLTLVGWLLVAAFLIGLAALMEAWSQLSAGHQVPGVVTYRLLAIFAISVTLFYFLWRARLGFWWAYSRLRLFSIVFPVVAVVTSLIPGLYPGWMVEEQLLFSVVLVLVFLLLNKRVLREAYAKGTATA